MNCQSFAASPSFSLQGIYNSDNGWDLENVRDFTNAKNITECTTTQHHFPSPQIAAVNYISDGKTLNSTLWLSSPFKEPIISSSSIFQQVERRYALLIHVNSAFDIGQNYQIVIEWDSTSHAWTRKIIESSPPSIFQTEKVLDQKSNYTGFFVRGKNYVDLYFNLSVASYPNQYNVVAYASDTFMTKDSHLCHLIDITDVVPIPPPEFVISTSPGSVALFPGENKTIELQVKSNTNLESVISFFTTNQTNDIKLKFIPNTTSILPYSMATSLLQIKASEKADAHPYTLPIYTKISFPTIITNWLSGSIHSNPKSIILNKPPSNVTITVLASLTIGQQIKNMWESWGSPISGFVGLITAIGGGIAGLLLKKFKDKWNKRNKSNKFRKYDER